MQSFIIVYIPSNDFHAAEIACRIACFPGAAKLAETTHLVATTLTAEEVFERVAVLPRQDQLYVLAVTKPYSGEGSRKADEWLHAHLSAPRMLPAKPPDLIR